MTTCSCSPLPHDPAMCGASKRVLAWFGRDLRRRMEKVDLSHKQPTDNKRNQPLVKKAGAGSGRG